MKLEIWDIHEVIVVNLFKVQVFNADTEMFRVRGDVLIERHPADGVDNH